MALAIRGRQHTNGDDFNGRAERETIPHNYEAEEGVLGSILLDPTKLDELRLDLSASDFFRDAHQVIYLAICELADAGTGVDALTVSDRLRDRPELDGVRWDDRLGDLLGKVPHAANARFYAQIVLQKSVARKVLFRADEMRRMVFGQQHTSEQLVSLALGHIASIGLPCGSNEFVGLKPWPDEPAPEIFRGLAGEIVRMIAPHTESDPMAILGQLLVAFGNAIGRRAHWRVEASAHYTNLFLCVVGNSSKARKGTSWDYVRWLMAKCDDDWCRQRIMRGMSSGEGLIWQVRDPIMRREKIGGTKSLGGGGYQDIEVDPGVKDKRALFVESEFGTLLAMMNRDGNTLSGVLRQSFDDGFLSSSPKHNAARATGAHISVIGHITAEELNSLLTRSDAANGFANRFLWVCARRQQYLPHGGRIHEVNFTEVVKRLKEVFDFATADDFEGDRLMKRDDDADKLWEEVYPKLSEPKLGLFGAVTGRAEALAMRVASLYAIFDCSPSVRRHHLESGLAFWRYCEQSAAYIFGDALGDPEAEHLLGAIRAAGDAGLTASEICTQVFANHGTKEQRGAKMSLLMKGGMVELTIDKSTPRPTKRYKAVH